MGERAVGKEEKNEGRKDLFPREELGEGKDSNGNFRLKEKKKARNHSRKRYHVRERHRYHFRTDTLQSSEETPRKLECIPPTKGRNSRRLKENREKKGPIGERSDLPCRGRGGGSCEGEDKTN